MGDKGQKDKDKKVKQSKAKKIKNKNKLFNKTNSSSGLQLRN